MNEIKKILFKKPKILLGFFAVLMFLYKLIFANAIHADDKVVSDSAKLKIDSYDQSVDLRITRLQNFFKKYNSPLEGYAFDLIWYADRYNIDWRLVPAISGVESTFGKRIPKSSYNAYGWANGKYYFLSWDQSIETVSKSLREKYYDKGATNINKIARRYAPPSNSWSWKVKYFMKKIDPIPVEFDL